MPAPDSEPELTCPKQGEETSLLWRHVVRMFYFIKPFRQLEVTPRSYGKWHRSEGNLVLDLTNLQQINGKTIRVWLVEDGELAGEYNVQATAVSPPAP